VRHIDTRALRPSERVRLSTLPPEVPREARKSKLIHVRRFAGPVAYRDSIEHVRVAHLTDLHVGRVTPMEVQLAAIERTNAARPDLVVITGDFVCHSQKYLDELTDLMAALRAPVFAVLGNHDYWSGADEVRMALRRARVEILDNAHTTITVKNQRLQVLGLDDAYTGHADRARATRGLRRDIPVLGLSHIAEEADALWASGVPFVLSGHTHAGQITLARLHELAIGKIAGHKYIHGLYGDRRASGSLYVGAGIGAAVMPLRWGDRAKRELAIFELGHEPGSFEEHHAEQEALPGRAPSERTKAERFMAVEHKRLRRENKKR
jgi:uncharacterized protein